MKHPKSYDTTPETQSRMSKVHLKKGKAESVLAKALYHSGLRYRLNDKRLPGSPDIAILKHHIAVFVDGEFWHGKDWYPGKVKRNTAYWDEKIQENITRDARNDALLRSMDWVPIHFWSKDAEKHSNRCVGDVLEIIAQISALSLPLEK